MGFKSPNYTQVPNELFDVLLKDLPMPTLKVLLASIRKILGFHKRKDAPEPISISQFEEMTGLARASVVKGIKHAVELGYLVKVDGEDGQTSRYLINFEAESEVVQSVNQSNLYTSSPNELEVVHAVDTQKKTIKEKQTYAASADAGDTCESQPSPTQKRKQAAVSQRGQHLIASLDEAEDSDATQQSDTTPPPPAPAAPPSPKRAKMSAEENARQSAIVEIYYTVALGLDKANLDGRTFARYRNTLKSLLKDERITPENFEAALLGREKRFRPRTVDSLFRMMDEYLGKATPHNDYSNIFSTGD